MTSRILEAEMRSTTWRRLERKAIYSATSVIMIAHQYLLTLGDSYPGEIPKGEMPSVVETMRGVRLAERALLVIRAFDRNLPRDYAKRIDNLTQQVQNLRYRFFYSGVVDSPAYSKSRRTVCFPRSRR